jgi:hypothetical protein
MTALPSSAPASERPGWRDGLALLGAFVVAAYAVHRLPPARDLVHLPRTPIDNSRIRESAPEYRLLQDAAAIVPPAATVVVESASGDPKKDFYLQRFGIALLPGRRIVARDAGEQAGYVVLVGQGAAIDGGQPLLVTGDGSIWSVKRR